MSLVPFTAEETQRLRQSFLDLIPVSDRASADFYERIFQVAPGVRELFSADLEAQQEKFMQMLAVSLDYLEQPDTLAKMCSDLGVRHVGYGAMAGHYPVVRAALLASLAAALGEKWQAPLPDLWGRLLVLIEGFMLTEAPSP